MLLLRVSVIVKGPGELKKKNLTSVGTEIRFYLYTTLGLESLCFLVHRGRITLIMKVV